MGVVRRDNEKRGKGGREDWEKKEEVRIGSGGKGKRVMIQIWRALWMGMLGGGSNENGRV